MRLLLILLIVWQLLGWLWLEGRAALLVPLPSGVLVTLWELLREGELGGALLRSTGRVFVGGGLGAALGVLTGAVMAAGWAGAMLRAPLAMLRPIPPIAWIPLSLLWFGMGEVQQLVILGGASFHVVAAGTADAVMRVPQSLVDSAENLGAGPGTRLAVRLRAAAPGVVFVLREGFAIAWFVLVAAELVSATEGLGVLVLQGRDLLLPARTFVGMALLAAAGGLTDQVLARVEQVVKHD